MQSDIPRYIFSPIAYIIGLREKLFNWQKRRDRGIVLEEQWLSLSDTFSDFRKGEKLGWRPSLIFSPTLVETGQPLLISNLDLSELTLLNGSATGLAVELFSWFPYMQKNLKIQTALRMNASFPLISPAVSLPTTPTRRVVDAGYYDNHGVSIAATWLQDKDVLAWIKKNTSGVIIIQIRAFSSKIENEKEDRNTVFDWLFSPLTAVANVRSHGSRARNDQLIENLQNQLGKLPVNTVIFENRTGSKVVEMSWYMRKEALEAMNRELKKSYNRCEMEKLIKYWTDTKSATDTQGACALTKTP